MKSMRMLALWVGLAWTAGAQAGPTVVDDSGAEVRLARPAQRIVSLAPHATELLFAVGAGAQVVAVTDYSDYPAEAARRPRVGGYNGISLEKVLALRPDLIVGWQSGNPPRDLARLRQLGVPVYLSEAADLDGVARNMERLGVLAGREVAGRQAAAGFRQQLARLRQAQAGKPRLRVFLQVSRQPLMTVNGRQFLTALLDVCGGDNVFAGLAPVVPQIGAEAVVAARPAVMMSVNERSSLDMWRRWPSIPAVAHGRLYSLPADLVSRPGPRLVEGAATVCRLLDDARAR